MPSSLRSPPGPIRVSSGLPARVGCSRQYAGKVRAQGATVAPCRYVWSAKTASRIPSVVAYPRGRLFPSPIRMGLGPSRLRRSLTWIRCRTPPFLLLPIGGQLALATWPDPSQQRIARQGRLFSAVRRQGPGAGCNSCTLPIRVVGEDGKSYPERRRISARSAFPESNPDGSGPEPASSKPDVDPVPDPAVSAAADPEVRGSVASRCRAQRSTARTSPTRSSRPCGSQPSQRAQDRSNRIVSVVALQN